MLPVSRSYPCRSQGPKHPGAGRRLEPSLLPALRNFAPQHSILRWPSVRPPSSLLLRCYDTTLLLRCWLLAPRSRPLRTEFRTAMQQLAAASSERWVVFSRQSVMKQIIRAALKGASRTYDTQGRARGRQVKQLCCLALPSSNVYDSRQCTASKPQVGRLPLYSEGQ